MDCQELAIAAQPAGLRIQTCSEDVDSAVDSYESGDGMIPDYDFNLAEFLLMDGGIQVNNVVPLVCDSHYQSMETIFDLEQFPLSPKSQSSSMSYTSNPLLKYPRRMSVVSDEEQDEFNFFLPKGLKWLHRLFYCCGVGR